MVKSKRLYFIDAVRAFAIIMMLQGHFVDELLHPQYKENNDMFFTIWHYLRGLTAPTFFTVSGFIFTYLLLKTSTINTTILRIKKGLYRGIMLIILGYLLRMDALSWLRGNFNSYFLEVDVLHCIGLSLLITIVLYKLFSYNTYVFSVILLATALVCFLIEPFLQHLSFSSVPNVISNYFTKSNGSVFTILPWFGYFAFGVFMATYFYKFQQYKNFKLLAVLTLLSGGFFCIKWSAWCFTQLFKITDMYLFYQNASYNYLFPRFGNVLILFAIFYSLEQFLKSSIIIKTGQKTLSIYIIHSIILYGSFTGFGLNKYFKHALNLQHTFIGTLIFITMVCLISFYVNSNTLYYSKIKNFVEKLKCN